MDPARLRAEFSVLDEHAYLNAGTCGPLPRAGVSAVHDVLAQAAVDGRGGAYYEALTAARASLRMAYADALGASADDVALTTSTSEGVVRVLGALDLAAGDEVLTSDEEHPGLQGPLAAARAQRGIVVRAVPFAQIAAAARPSTKLVACSHVSWISGAVVPDLTDVGEIPVLLDGAQGIGAVPTDVASLGCAFYAGSGQKWLCGPVGSGMLWVAPRWRDRLPAIAPTYLNLADPAAGLAASPRSDGARLDTSAQSLETIAAAVAAIGVLRDAGWHAVHGRAAALAGELADALTSAGCDVTPRGATTLVSWKDADPATTRTRLAAAGVLIRDLPGTGLLRASVGAWNDATDLDRLLSALAA